MNYSAHRREFRTDCPARVCQSSVSALYGNGLLFELETNQKLYSPLRLGQARGGPKTSDTSIKLKLFCGFYALLDLLSLQLYLDVEDPETLASQFLSGPPVSTAVLLLSFLNCQRR